MIASSIMLEIQVTSQNIINNYYRVMRLKLTQIQEFKSKKWLAQDVTVFCPRRHFGLIPT